MEKLSKLWDFQQAEQELEKREHKVSHSPSRVRFRKLHNYLLEQQNHLQRIGDDVTTQHKRLVEMQAEYDDCTTKLENNMSEAEKMDESDLDSVQSVRKRAEEIQSKLVALRKELNGVVKQLQSSDKLLEDMRGKLSKAKKDYQQYKEKCEQEKKENEPIIREAREKLKSIEAALDADLLKRYRKIQTNRPLPIALIAGEQCNGCNMSLPSLVVRRVKEGKAVIECENCGRILYFAE